MNLLIDIGNTRIKWALQDGEEWISGTPLVRGSKPFKDIARPAWKELETPERVIVSNVAGAEFEKSVCTWVKRRWKILPEFLHSRAEQCGVINAYTKPERLGNDRWAALIAAHGLCRGAAVILGCGTAITVDALSADGRHLGGLIAPGVELMISSVCASASDVTVEDGDTGEIVLLASSTESAVLGGSLYAAVSLLDRISADLRGELGNDVSLLLTGGDAGRLMPLLESRPAHEPELILKGLAIFARETAS
ncbi:type III pantothenate kinase [Thiogranum longum]|uniref:Type III pantothenate kinase n=1 Tax=Thiogranum longum TaxID=1537524 RepID=A0A4R1HII5_9GAMM|nr:type III pantothenate kinase [Thiogranum longum]TCK19249.1 type III pantothenate kinase [Thiogranum longum]